MEEEDFKNLPVEERCVHKLWKARVNGYEEVTKLFQQIDDEKSPEFAKYLGVIKKFVTDSNAMGQEKGLEATLAYIENYALAGKTVGEVMSGIVGKCIAASRTRTRDLAQQVTLMYVEIEKQDAVYDELMKGMDLKNPKIVAACVSAATHGLRDFGSKVVTVKPLVKKIATLFSDRDKNVRDEARLLAIEIYRWIGPVIKSQLTSLQPVQLTDLEQEFAKIDGHKAAPSRYLRSQQEKQAKIATEVANDDDNEDVENDGDGGSSADLLDPYELADPVDILSKLPKDFYDKLEEKNWKERKEALETLDTLLKAPKLENGDYGDLVRALKKVVQKDSNVICVALAAKCIAQIAVGLKKRFHTYASACIPALLEKFKEKKQNVVLACREAIDAVYTTTNIENILEDVLEAWGNKNPSVKAETSLFLARALCKTPPTALNKKLLKAYTGGLIKIINEPDPFVRDCCAEALGTLMKLVGDKAIRSFIADLEKDPLKMAKVKECCENAIIVSVLVATGKGKSKAVPTIVSAPKQPATAPPKTSTSVAKGSGIKRRPAVAAAAAAAAATDSSTCASNSKVVKAGGRGKPTSAVAAPTVTRVTERELGEDEAVEKMTEVLPMCPELAVTIPAAMTDTNWKTRLAAVEQLYGWLQHQQGADSVPTQACVRLVCKKPGLKDTNFQVLKCRLDIIKYLAVNCSFSSTAAECCVNDVVDKLSDCKNGVVASDTLTAMAEATHLSEVSAHALEFAFAQKNPKVLQETLGWLATAVKEFGIGNMNAKSLIDSAKKALASNNPSVRQVGITLLGSLYLFMGPNLHVFLENEKQALRDQINVEFEKYENEKPPAPIRGVKVADPADMDDDNDEAAIGFASAAPVVVNPLDLLPKVDISPQITDALLVELADKNWQVRIESLNKILTIITEARMIKPSLGELPVALALRLVDSNTKIAQTAMSVCETLAKSMSNAGRQHIRTFFPGFLQGLGDSKAWIRTAALTSINAFAEQCGYKEFFESEMIHDALKGGSPTLRSELWTWLAEVLPKIKSVPKEELLLCVPYLYANLEDRNADVRKNAGEAVLGIMIHLGFEAMVKQIEKLKPSSKPVIQAILEKTRPNLPERPAASKKAVDDKRSLPTAARVNTTNAPPKAIAKKIGAIAKPTVASRSKKEEDVDTSPLLVTNNLKTQRTIDETKLKVLKWNFVSPREEFVDLLREQMTTAGVNRTLMQNMFHSDFKYHIRAIESLSEDLADNGEALISNLDLVLKWLTLRFFDTNPSVLLKGLEYLNAVFTMLSATSYHMLDIEASSFIPYLVVKVGDPKDSVRNGVRILFRHICNVYAISKMFAYIMEGLKSKNARQRAECLDIMGNIISDYGMCVCLPSESACMKEVAKQISDRDNSVRNAALNCVVQAFYIVGERVYKLVGKITDKDLSLLEERIKRASKQRPVVPAQHQSPPKTITTVKPIGKFTSPTSPLNATVIYNSGRKGEGDADSYEEESCEMGDAAGDMGAYDAAGEAEMMADVTLPPQVSVEPQVQVSGPFHLDDELLQKLDSIQLDVPDPKLVHFELDFLKEDVVMPTLQDTRKQVQQTAAKPTTAIAVPISPNARHNIVQHVGTGQELIVQNIITNMASADILTASQAFDQLQSILRSPKSMLLLKLEDQFMAAIASQLKFLFTQDPKANVTVLRQYKALLTVVDSFYANKALGKNVTMPILKDVLMHFIRLLIEANLNECPDGDTFIRVINIHSVKIIERSDHTAMVCCLVQLLGDCVRTDQQERVIDLAMKCLWRVIRIMPTWADHLVFDDILLQIHMFFCEFPSAWWKTREVDTPLRTIKTIIHSMTKIKGAALMLHLSLVPHPNESEMEAFILKLLKNLKLDEVKAVPLKSEATNAMNANSTPTPPPRPHRALSKSMHAQLTEIFKKIGSKEETMLGMNLLYDFMQQHPEEDIEPFLKRSSQFFQDYIQKNLKEIERCRKENNSGSNNGNIGSDLPMPPLRRHTLGTGSGGGGADLDGNLKGPEYYQRFLDSFLPDWEEKIKHFHQINSNNNA